MYQEDNFLQLSGIQHYAFCKRQWGLAYIELQWAENLRTVEGHLMHRRAHDGTIMESRGELIVSRAMPVQSKELGISGECDVVEFHKDMSGVYIPRYDGNYKVIPVEYKKGRPKENEIDILQLAAQTMCLEEMLCCQIEMGYLYYGETKHRLPVPITEEVREKTRTMFAEMHEYYERGVTPRGKRTKACNACSLKDLCLPTLMKAKSVHHYVTGAIEDSEG